MLCMYLTYWRINMKVLERSKRTWSCPLSSNFFFLNVKLYQLHALLPGLLKRRLLFAHVPVATVLFSAALQHTFVNSVLVLHALTLCVWLLFIRSGSEWTEANLHIKRLRKINDAKTKFWVFFAAGRLKKTDLISALIRWCLWNALPG